MYMHLTVSAIVDSSSLCVEPDVQSLGELDGQLVVAVTATEVGASELKVIVLVPVFEGELRERSGIGKLQVGKVPVQDLTVARRQVHGAGWGERKQ